MIKKIRDKEYALLESWWKAREGWEGVPRHFLPKDGYLVYLGEKPIVGGFLYLPKNGVVAWLTWIVANPHTTHTERKLGIEKLLKAVNRRLEKEDIEVLYTDSPIESLTDTLMDNGFIKADENITHLFYSNN